MPLLRIPIHVSYLLFLAERAPALVMPYVETALALCAATKTAPSLLLHPLDFLGGDEVPALAFFPAMSLRPSRSCAGSNACCNGTSRATRS